MKIKSFDTIGAGKQNIGWAVVFMAFVLFGISDACWNPPSCTEPCTYWNGTACVYYCNPCCEVCRFINEYYGYQCRDKCEPYWNDCKSCDNNCACTSYCPTDWYCCGDGGCCPNGTTCCGDEWCCNPDLCQECVDGQCVVCDNDPKKCCDDSECKDCCKDSTTGNCEAHNSDCGCAPLLVGCPNKIKEWTLGATHFCYSECSGEPCNYILNEKDCYAWQACKAGSSNWGSVCNGTAEYCEGIIPLGFCQECIPDGVAHVVEEYDCRCPL